MTDEEASAGGGVRPVATGEPAMPPRPAGGTSFFKVMMGVLAGGCLLIVIVVVVGCALFGSCARRVRQKVAEEQKRLENEPVSDLSWQEVEDRFGPASKRTRLQKQEDWKGYRGRKVRWSGTVLAVSDVLGATTLQVQLNPQAGLRTVLVSDAFVALRAGDQERARALELKTGGAVTFEAVLDAHNVKLGNRAAIVTLRHGRIVE